MSHEVFVSYSSKDKSVADAVCAAVEDSGTACWIAPRDVVAGTPYGEALIDAINGSQIMVLILSEHSNHSQQVVREVERAISKGIPIVPFRIADVRLAKSLEYFLSTCHWLDASDGQFSRHLPKLTEAVNASLRQIYEGETLQFEAPIARPPQAKHRNPAGAPIVAAVVPLEPNRAPQSRPAHAGQQFVPTSAPVTSGGPVTSGHRTNAAGPYASPTWGGQNSLPQVKPTNVLGIVGLTTSILGIFSCGMLSPFGFFISLLGLFKAPRGSAIAGSVIGSLGSGVFLALFAYGFWGGFTTGLTLQEAVEQIDNYHLSSGELPDDAAGASLLSGQRDSWNNELRYRRTPFGYEIRSAGLDELFDTSDDQTIMR